MVPLTRKEFYDLAETCLQHALELARHEQSRVNLEQCRLFNQWLPQVKAYDRLSPILHDLAPARPITRWHMMAASVVLWFILIYLLRGRLAVISVPLLSYGLTAMLVILYFVPERFYGTTIELLEGKTLRVVDALEVLLESGEMGFSEAVYFRIKENLEAARRELRQQIDLAHRP